MADVLEIFGKAGVLQRMEDRPYHYSDNRVVGEDLGPLVSIQSTLPSPESEQLTFTKHVPHHEKYCLLSEEFGASYECCFVGVGEGRHLKWFLSGSVVIIVTL